MRVLLATISLAAGFQLSTAPRQRQPRRLVTKEAAPHRSDAPPECQPRRPRRDEAAALAPRHSDGRPEIDRRRALEESAVSVETHHDEGRPPSKKA